MHSRALIVAVLATSISFGALAASDTLQSLSQLVDQGQHAKALDLVDHYLASHPEDVQGQFLKGVILEQQKNNAEAIRIFSRIVETHPQLPEPYNNLAVLYAEQGQYEQARLALEKAIRTHPTYATAHQNLSDIYAKMASDAYDKALQLDKKEARQTRLAIKLSMVTSLYSSNPSLLRTSIASKDAPKAVVPASASLPPAPAIRTVASAQPPGSVLPPQAQRPASPADHDEQTLMAAVKNWAEAWSAQDVNAYLACYAADFKTPGGESRKAWEKLRRTRISTPKSIQVDLADIEVAMKGDSRASIRFKQSYRANRGTIRTPKTLMMEKIGDKWLIEQELTAR